LEGLGAKMNKDMYMLLDKMEMLDLPFVTKKFEFKDPLKKQFVGVLEFSA
jgi:hypothetical protein